ncbi:hypothetical protein ACFYY2_01070 [Streptomyces sp. NPDC001822]|uniref:hypothetical protein n=1 Tax=Streptomyces sp. NPDC001822 TaxID=3364614 RepID=UPI0036B4BC88
MSLLLAPHLPLSGSSGPHTHASTPGITADRPPETASEKPNREYGTCGAPDRRGEPNGLLRHRDRHRSTTAPAVDTPARSAVADDSAGLLAPAAVAAMGNAQHTSRSSTAHSSHVLQVFRC